jgi:hypothetical protein
MELEALMDIKVALFEALKSQALRLKKEIIYSVHVLRYSNTVGFYKPNLALATLTNIDELDLIDLDDYIDEELYQF